MEESDSLANRIEIGGRGFGEGSAQTIEDRAADLARQSGRTMPNDADRQAALDELRNPVNPAAADEFDLAEDERAGDGTPAVDTGTRAPTFEPDDEQALPERLVLEGLEEADHESRAASAELAPDNDEARLGEG